MRNNKLSPFHKKAKGGNKMLNSDFLNNFFCICLVFVVYTLQG